MQLEPTLNIKQGLWNTLLIELHARTEGKHESGAFLLGRKTHQGRDVAQLVFYDELDPSAYDSGVCILHGDAFGRLWDHCAATGLVVLADAHVHGLGAGQSRSDRENPMIARPGHLALILPLMARPPVRRWSIGLYKYLGNHQWHSLGGRAISQVLKIESPND